MIRGDKGPSHTPITRPSGKRSSYTDWFAVQNAASKGAHTKARASVDTVHHVSGGMQHQTAGKGATKRVAARQSSRPVRGQSRALAYLVLSLLGLLVVVVAVMKLIPESESLPDPMSLPQEHFQVYKIEHQSEIAELAQRYDLDPYLICAVINTESGWDATAKSHVGAVGLMQVMPSTAEWMVKKRLIDEREYPLDQLADPRVNMEYGTCYLAYLMKRFNNLNKVVAGYNGGPANVERWESAGAENFESVIDYPETKEYISRVRTAYRGYKKEYPTAFGSEQSESIIVAQVGE